jgi:hypothetical protein
VLRVFEHDISRLAIGDYLHQIFRANVLLDCDQRFAASRGTTLPWYESAKVCLFDLDAEPLWLNKDKNSLLNTPDNLTNAGV